MTALKKALRKEMMGRLYDMNQTHAEQQALAVTAKLLATKEYKAAKRVSLFMSMPHEINTKHILADIFYSGRQCYIPLCQNGQMASNARSIAAWIMQMQRDCAADPRRKSDYIMFANIKDMMLLQTMEDFEALRANQFGVKEPNPADKLPTPFDDNIGLDLIVMPGLAFDKNCNRLGYGKGYYDAYLKRCYDMCAALKRPKPSAIAVCFDEQIVEQVPTADHDVQIDAVITSTQTFGNLKQE